MRKAAFNSEDRKRLYKEAKSFMKLRAARNRAAKEMRADTARREAEKPATQVAGD